ncbi:MAG: metallophosphoesterase [Anaerolineales bacterium]
MAKLKRYFGWAWGGGLLIGAGVGLYATLIEPQWLQVRRIPLRLRGLHPAFGGYRLVQISDLHIDSWLGKERLEAIVARVNAQQPDLVAITGDFVSWEKEDAPDDLPEVLRALRAPDGVVGVTGNHDYHSGMHSIRQAMREANIRDLDNTVYAIARDGGCLFIAGVDDPLRGEPDLDAVLRQLDGQADPAILLAHEPEFAADSAPSGRFALQLSGHTHGGQVQVPFIGAVYLPEGSEQYIQGMYQLNDMLLYVNRGLGMVRLKARFNCRPEITVFTLYPA